MSIDLVKYSDLPSAQQVKAIERLIASVRDILRRDKSLKPGFFLPTGDGMIVGYKGDPLRPLMLAVALHKKYGRDRKKLKIGINQGLAFAVRDINGKWNYAGSGINFAQRVESCCSDGHILVKYASEHVRDLPGEWPSHFSGPYKFRVKRGRELEAYNLCDRRNGEFGRKSEPRVNRAVEGSDDVKDVKNRVSPSGHARRVAIVVSETFHRRPFFAALLHYVLLRCAARGYEGVIKLPHEDKNLSEQARHLNELLSHGHDYAAAVVVPMAPDDADAELASFVADFQKPVVFVDLDPFAGRRYPKGAFFVGCNNSVGGQIAARLVAQAVAGIENPKVLVIDAQIQTERQTAFRADLLAAKPGADITTDDAGFDRDRAKRIARRRLTEAFDAARPFSAVFATSDDMALGVWDACQELSTDVNRPIIVGFDGTSEAERFIRAPRSIFFGTVRQNIPALAEAIVHKLSHVGKSPREPRQLLEPSAFSANADVTF